MEAVFPSLSCMTISWKKLSRLTAISSKLVSGRFWPDPAAPSSPVLFQLFRKRRKLLLWGSEANLLADSKAPHSCTKFAHFLDSPMLGRDEPLLEREELTGLTGDQMFEHHAGIEPRPLTAAGATCS